MKSQVRQWVVFGVSFLAASAIYFSSAGKVSPDTQIMVSLLGFVAVAVLTFLFAKQQNEKEA